MSASRESTETAEILDGLARPAALCAMCPKLCRSACPVSEAEANETLTPWGKMSLVHLARTKHVSLTEPGVQRALDACTGCGACVEKCAHGNPVAESLFVARGASRTSRTAGYRAEFERSGDVKGRDHRGAIEGLERNPRARVAYFPGCMRASADGAAAIVRDLRALSVACGAAVPVCDIGPPAEGKAQCCGYPLYAAGQLDLVEDNFRRLGDVLSGHEIVVTPDPGCAYMLSTVFKVLGESASSTRGADVRFPVVVPLVEVLAQHAERFEGVAHDLVVRYHDPCYLARRGRTVDAPRKLLRAATGRWPLEFHRRMDAAECSGSGGLYPTSNPEGARAIARQRVTQDPTAHDRAELLVTACPSARRGFERAGFRVADIVDVLSGGVSAGPAGPDVAVRQEGMEP